MRLLFIPVFLIVMPVILGLPWCCVMMRDNLKRTLACLPMGYFLQFALFQLLAFPFACLHFSFSSLCVTFICVDCICAIASLIWLRRHRTFHLPRLRLSGWAKLYLLIFAIILCYQLYNAFTLDRTYMSYDDASYVARANDALTQDILYAHDPYTGLGTRLSLQRAMQGSLIFPSFLSRVSTVELVTMEHTILDIYYLLLAYVTYAYLSVVLFNVENAPVFLLLTAVLYTFGNYSMYSPTMRLLGLNYPGKAILAIIFFPLLYALMTEMVKKKYARSFGVVLLMLSVAASGLTLFATITLVGSVTVIVALSLIRKPRRWKNIRYVLYAGFFPLLYGSIYFAYRFYLI